MGHGFRSQRENRGEVGVMSIQSGNKTLQKQRLNYHVKTTTHHLFHQYVGPTNFVCIANTCYAHLIKIGRWPGSSCDRGMTR